MSKSIAYKVRLVEVVVREIYHHDYTRFGEENALISAEDENLNPINNDSIEERITVHDWDDFKHMDVTQIEDLGVDDDGEE
jgi:hypothetical protein